MIFSTGRMVYTYSLASFLDLESVHCGGRPILVPPLLVPWVSAQEGGMVMEIGGCGLGALGAMARLCGDLVDELMCAQTVGALALSTSLAVIESREQVRVLSRLVIRTCLSRLQLGESRVAAAKKNET